MFQENILYSELLYPYVPSISLRSSASHMLVVPKTHYVEISKRKFGVRAPSEWNRLPLELQIKPTVDSF